MEFLIVYVDEIRSAENIRNDKPEPVEVELETVIINALDSQDAIDKFEIKFPHDTLITVNQKN